MTTRTPIREHRDELADRLEAEGYEIGKPHHVTADCLAMDQQTAAEGHCDACGHQGLEFLAFRPTNRNERGYRCLLWCSACDAAVEM